MDQQFAHVTSLVARLEQGHREVKGRVDNLDWHVEELEGRPRGVPMAVESALPLTPPAQAAAAPVVAALPTMAEAMQVILQRGLLHLQPQPTAQVALALGHVLGVQRDPLGSLPHRLMGLVRAATFALHECACLRAYGLPTTPQIPYCPPQTNQALYGLLRDGAAVRVAPQQPGGKTLWRAA